MNTDTDTGDGEGPLAQRDRHDAALQRRLGLARTPGRENLMQARHLQAELIAGYRTWTNGIIRGRVGGVADPTSVAGELTAIVLTRVARRLSSEHEFHKPLRRIVLDYIDWAIKDYFKSPARNEPTHTVEDIDAVEADERYPQASPSEPEQARAFDARLTGLSENDREIVIDRYWRGLKIAEIAEKRGCSVSTCEQACSRASRRLAAGSTMADVRKSLTDSDSQAC